MQSFLKTFSDLDLQTPFDAAVVMPTTIRTTIEAALHSVFTQKFRGTIQILIGIDKPQGDLAELEAALALRPRNVAVQIFWPGYSTSQRHGGVMKPGDGGALRTILTCLANSPFIAYLDDDNWWGPNHLKFLRTAIAQAEWAFSLRWFVHPETRKPICVDQWESLGPGAGYFRDRFGGFVDPNCLMINKLACPQAAQYWCLPILNNPMLADRAVFDHLLKNHKPAATGRPSVFYTMNASDGLHQIRIGRMQDAYEAAGRIETARDMQAA